jgi:hypothetical protein
MKKAVWSGVIAFVGMAVMSTSAFAQAPTANINVQVNVNARAKLTLGTAAISFADADPDVTPTFTSAPVSIDVKARTTAGGAVNLTVLANGDFANGASLIPLNTLTWTVAGDAGLQAGATSKATAQTVGAWTDSGNHTGSHTYSLPNLWSYATGTYQVQLNYTLATP